MNREAIQRALCKANCFRWRVQEREECAGPCQANEFQLEIRHGRAADNVLDLVASPTDGAEPASPKVRHINTPTDTGKEGDKQAALRSAPIVPRIQGNEQ